MRIIFVGIHNKPKMKPLDSKTKTGQWVDEVIEQVAPIKCIKSNLYNLYQLPHKEKPKDHYLLWRERVRYDPEKDIVVCLGKIVSHAIEPHINIISVQHPSSIWSTEKRAHFIKECAMTIKERCQ
jgi:hypothetical protein